MAVSLASTSPPLSAAEAAQIPSSSLPIGPQISHLLSQFTSLSLSLFSVISSASLSLVADLSKSTQPIYTALAEVDDKLSRLLVMYDEHQQKQRRIEALISQLKTLDETWHASTLSLHACVQSLAPIVSSGALDRSSIAASAAAGLTPQSLLSYARLLAPFTSAPPSSILPSQEERDKLKGVGATDPTGRSLPMGAIPPFPTEAAMRRGRLQFGREGAGVGETNEVGGAFAFPSLLFLLMLTSSPPNAVRRDSTAGDGAALPPPKPDVATRLEQEAKAHQAGGAGSGGGMEVEEFEFDLDLNPDL